MNSFTQFLVILLTYKHIHPYIISIQKGSFTCCINGKDLTEQKEIALNNECNFTQKLEETKEPNNEINNTNNNNAPVNSNKPKKKAFLARSMTVNDPTKAKETVE